MGQTRSNPDGATGYRDKRDMLLKLLPKYAFVTAKAAREAGYKDSYIRSGLHKVLANDAWYCEQKERLKAEFIGLEQDEIESADNKLKNLINSGDLGPAHLLKALELFYRRHGALADKQIFESAERERELSQAERAEARRLSVVLMREQGKEGAA